MSEDTILDGWVGEVLWATGERSGFTLESLWERSSKITIGIHGGGVDELLGIGVVGVDDQTGEWLAWGHGFISDVGLLMQGVQDEAYNCFIKDGDLTLVEKLPSDIERLIFYVRKSKETGKLLRVGMQPSPVGEIVDMLSEVGINGASKNLCGLRQGAALGGAIKTIERKLASGKLIHSDGRMLRWCSKGAVIKCDRSGIYMAAQNRPINPLMALVMAVELMCTQ